MNKHRKQKIWVYVAAIIGAGYLAVSVADDLLRPKPLSGLSLAPDQRAASLNALVQRGAKTEAAWKDKTKRTKLTSDVEFSRQSNALAAKLRERRARQLGVSNPAIPITGEQRAHVAALNGAFHAAGGVETRFAGDNGTVTYLALPKKAAAGIKGNPANAAKAQPQMVAKKFLAENRALLKLDDPDAETQLTGEQVESSGQSHLRFQQTYRGVPLFGKELLVHLDGEREVYLMQGRYEPTPKAIDTAPRITPDVATSAAFKEIGLGVYKLPHSTSALVIHTSTRGAMKLAYKIVTTPRLDERWIHFVDANTGAVIDRIYDVQEAVVAGSGTDLNGQVRSFNVWSAGSGFNLIDPNTPTVDSVGYDPIVAINAGNPKSDTFILTAKNLDGSNLDFVTSTSANSWDATGVSAADNTRKVFDYYKNTHGRNSIDGKGGSLLAVIRFGDRLENAFWSSPYMVYGDGGDTFKPLAGCLDVAGHEMTHGVVENTAGLIYQNQSGALNESFADIFGAMVDRADWTLGEDCTKRSPFYLRNMANPALGLSRQPTKMSEYRQLPQTKAGDNGGVHVNSGIPNRAAYLMAEGLTLEGLGTSIGRGNTERIFYRALTTYLTQSSQFLDARRATIRAAQDLFPGNEVSVARAWDVVEVTDNSNPAPVPTPTDPIAGNDLMIYLSKSVIPEPPGSGFDIFVQRLANPLTAYSAANDKQSTVTDAQHTRPAVFSFNEGGSGRLLTDILFVDGTNNVSATELDPANLTFLTTDVFTDSGDFSSIAISPEGRFFAYTTTDGADNQIHFLDGNDDTGQSDFNITIVPENHQDTAAVQNTVLYADALHFDYSSRYVIFDALNCASVPGSQCSDVGGGFNYWSIGRVDLQTKQVLYLIPNQDPLVDTGNPVYATNSQSIIALDVADRRDAANLKYKVVTWDLEQQTENLIRDLGANGFGSGSRPSFWGNDDFITFLLPDFAKGRKAFRIGVNQQGVATTTVPEELNPNAATTPIMHRAGVRSLTGALLLNVSRLDFGSVAQADSKTLSITLTNGGNSDVSITGISIDNAQAYQTNLTNGLIPRGTSATFNVTFLPTGLVGTQIATLRITTDAQTASVNVPLNGTATGTPSGGGGGGGGGGCTMAVGSSAVDFGLTLVLLLAIGGGLLRRFRPAVAQK